MLTLRNDFTRKGGGFALMEGPGLTAVDTITIENGFSGQYLEEDGKWGRLPFAFPVVDGSPGTLLLGPHIVDHIPTELRIGVRSGDGRFLGSLLWADVIPSRKIGRTSSADFLAELRRQADLCPDKTIATEDRTEPSNPASRQAESPKPMVDPVDASSEPPQSAQTDRSDLVLVSRAAITALERKMAMAALMKTVRVEPADARPTLQRSVWPLAGSGLLATLLAIAALLTFEPDAYKYVLSELTALTGFPSTAARDRSSVRRAPPTTCRVDRLDPNGSNSLALRPEPEGGDTPLDATQMGPGTVVTVVGRSGNWIHVRLASGETGWAAGTYLTCTAIPR